MTTWTSPVYFGVSSPSALGCGARFSVGSCCWSWPGCPGSRRAQGIAARAESRVLLVSLFSINTSGRKMRRRRFALPGRRESGPSEQEKNDLSQTPRAQRRTPNPSPSTLRQGSLTPPRSPVLTFVSAFRSNPFAFQANSFQQVSPLWGGPPGPRGSTWTRSMPRVQCSITEQADRRRRLRTGGPPHPTQAAASFRRLSVASPTYRLEPVVI